MKYGVSFIVFLFLSFSSFAALAASQSVVEVINFACPHCAAVSKHLGPLQQRLRSRGGTLDVVPIFLEAKSSWPARVYLSLGGLSANDQTLVRQALFQAIQAQGLTLSDLNATCVVVSDALAHLSMQQCLARAQSGQGAKRLRHFVQLMEDAGLSNQSSGDLTLPLFIIEKNQNITQVLSYSDLSNETQLVEAVNHALDQ